MIDLRLGDCLEVLRMMPDQSVHCCVTSPPYWGLRDYGHDGQIGLEQTPEQYVARLVDVLREVRRVLRDDGTLWLNLGDSYASSQSSDSRTPDERAKSSTLGPKRDGLGGENAGHRSVSFDPRPRVHGLKPKDLVGIPWRVAFALQADGWWLRQDIIWAKPNPMPESVTDRCTKAHEYVFLLSKSARYFYDVEAIKEPHTAVPFGGKDKGFAPSSPLHATPTGIHGPSTRGEGRCGNPEGGRNRRSVWTITTKPYSGAHFATFPPMLPRLCIMAGCPVGGTVLDPFMGSGTTGQEALSLARQFVGIELNPEYMALAEHRLNGAQLGLGLEVGA